VSNQNKEETQGFVQRFLFEGLDIRGAFVRLDQCWQAMQAGRMYAPPVARLLGEMAAVTALIGGQMKQEGRLTFQLRGPGAIKRLVMDCNESLQMRGMAHADLQVADLPVPELLGAARGGQLMLSLDLPSAKQPYQSYVPLVGDSVAAIFEYYLEQSEQQPSRLFLQSSDQAACCLFLQKLPAAAEKDADGWDRISHLAGTVKPEELLGLMPDQLLMRLFHEEMEQGGIRLFDPRPVSYYCPEDWEKVRGMLRSLGQAEAEAILSEHGEILILDDICNREYRFSAADVAELFSPSAMAAATSGGPTLH
jgi:molecular chaperone Hsp33